MTALVPCDQIRAITGRYGDGWAPTTDQPVSVVRDVICDLRADAAGSYRAGLLAEAAELEALVDPVERAAAV